MLTAENISVRIGRTTVVDAINTAVVPGKVLALLGPNGAGKSTLLRTLSGEIEPATGQVRMDGQIVKSSTRHRQAKQRGVMPQHSTLNFPFSAIEVALMGRIPHIGRGVETPHDIAIASASLQRTDVSHLRDRSYPTLSGGEGQRVHFARVLTQIWEESSAGNRYLLLDEPTSSLDLAHQHRTLSTARELAASGVGVAMVVHDLNLAAEYADTILLMKNGRERATGTPEEVLTPDNIREVYNIAAIVQQHPCRPCPLVITLGHRDSIELNSLHHLQAHTNDFRSKNAASI